MQQLADVVAVLTLPVVASPSYAVSPVLGAICDNTLIKSLQHLRRLSSWKLQSTLHELGISARMEIINLID